MAQAPVPLPSTRPGRPKVLVVDENPDMCNTLELLLEGAGFDVVSARSAADGARLFMAHRPDAVLSELRLEGDDGLALCRRLRALAGPAAVLVAHTGWITPDIRLRAREAGFDRFVPKPAEPDALIALLRQACG